MTNQVVVQAQMIKDYEGPQWLVEPVGDASDEQDISSINEDCGFDVVDTNIAGWGYEAIIKVRNMPGCDLYYLANLGYN